MKKYIIRDVTLISCSSSRVFFNVVVDSINTTVNIRGNFEWENKRETTSCYAFIGGKKEDKTVTMSSDMSNGIRLHKLYNRNISEAVEAKVCEILNKGGEYA